MEFRILGPLEAVADGRSLALGGPGQRELLALLLLNRDQVVPIDRLIDSIWPERAPPTAANTLQVYVSRLRKALGADLIETKPPGYALRAGADAVDADRFERLAEEGSRALEHGAANEAADLLAGALDLWRGEPLADFAYESFATAEIARLNELRATATEDLIDAKLALGRHGELLAELERLVEAEPLRERPRGQLMTALYRAGRQAEALEEYRKARKMLRDELGLEPSPPLQRLERAILAQDESLEVAPRSAMPSLPEPATALVGRAGELAELEELFGDGAARLVTLTGPGGIGKTRLGLEVAHRLAPRLREGAAFVSLSSVADPGLIAGTIAQTLELPDSALERHLAGVEALVLLDNFEQLVDGASVLARVLESAPQLRLLVTSRIPLHVAAEHEFPVPPLEREGAVSLFVERATAVDPDLELSPRAEAAVAAICERLDGLPLAIELAAARAKLLPPEALLERLGNRLDLLSAGKRDAPDRHRTLRATIDWSYDLLEDPPRRLFARLAAFKGGCSLDAVEAICGDGVLEDLATLVDGSLLTRAGDGRFAMLGTIRDYALERLAASVEADEIRSRHAAYFTELAEQADAELRGPEQATWLARLELEHDNLRAAAAFFAEQEDGESLVRLCVALTRFWITHSHLTEGRRTLEGALAANPLAEPSLRAKALNAVGILAAQQGEFDAARAAFEQSLQLVREIGDDERVGRLLTNLGNLAFFRGELDEARRLYEQSLAEAVRRGARREQAIARENLGLLALASDDAEDAAAVLGEAEVDARKSGDERQLASVCCSLAAAVMDLGRLARADELLRESLELSASLDDAIAIAHCLDAFAGLASLNGAPERAATLFGAADGLRASVGAIREPDQQPLYDRWLARTLSDLDPERYTALHEQGEQLAPEAARALALERTGATV